MTKEQCLPYSHTSVTKEDRGTDYWEFKAQFSDEEILECLEQHGIPTKGHSTGVAHDCSGLGYCNPIILERGKNSVTAALQYGLDV